MEELLSTPRTLEACKIAGVAPSELQPRSFSEFYVPGDLLERQRLRFNHFEHRRQELLNDVIQERARLIERGPSTLDQGTIEAAGNLAVMEALIGKEARRLERDLRSQLRFYATVERDNEEQLSKEEQLRQIVHSRKSKIQNAEKIKQIKSEKIKVHRNAREKIHQTLVKQIRQDFGGRQTAFVAHLVEEDRRVHQFRAGRASETSDKSKVWRDKVHVIKSRFEQILDEQNIKGQSILDRHLNKLHSLEKKKVVETQARLLRHEETTLKLIDAQSKRKRMARLDQSRREMIAKQIDEEVQRVSTLISTKEEIMRQRQQILRQQESIKGRPMNIKKITPGPADYSQYMDSIHEHPAPKISDVKPPLMVPGALDFELKRAQGLPPPGAYDLKVLPSGDAYWPDTGVSIGKGEKRTYLDEEQSRKKFLPGPGRYYEGAMKAGSLIATGAPKLVRDYYDADKAPEWIRPNDNTPGPATYTVDSFTRTERARKGQKAIPALAKALMMAIPEALRTP